MTHFTFKQFIHILIGKILSYRLNFSKLNFKYGTQIKGKWLQLISVLDPDGDPHKKCLLDPDPHGQMRIRIQEVKKHRKCTDSLGEYITSFVLLT